MTKKCLKSVTGKHLWRHGEVYDELKLFGLTFSTIMTKVIMRVEVCQACGLMKRKKL